MSTVYIYLVTWILSIWVSDPCPAPALDSYGLTTTTSCHILHGHFEEKYMDKPFTSLKAAQHFYDNAPITNNFGRTKRISDMKIIMEKK